ncbi:oligosaccharide flippase family protein [Lentilactobacillus sp. TOM.63]|uniref:putative polysaccharide biosynthesis protein n=1 Tax=Lentilactobacillus sp. TOM.63 TaxID=3055077 RepID=UPI0025A105DE|nr:oligosaccharide flippase family protein [Lentilactobacillus sp. TOM.63]MDM7515410.1 oligosaccharide flippase family protein [Lentilactobacillus sp. TOM.63]
MKNKSKRKQVLAGTLLLTVASFVAKLLSAVYRIPFQNMVGNIGFYVYQQIYPIYGIGMTFALTGLPVFISKLVADTPDPNDQIALVQRIQTVLVVICGFIFCILQFGAGIVSHAMADNQLQPVIRAVSWMFLLIPFLSSWRGYFQGKLNMKPTAYSQVVEQVIRVTVILAVAFWAARSLVNPYKMGTIAMLSAPIAGLAALMIVRSWVKKIDVPRPIKPDQTAHLLHRILLEGGTICLVTAVMLLLQLVDSFTLVSGLRDIGYSLAHAQNLKGIYDRSQTLVQMGLVVSTASVTAVMPSLAVANKKTQDVTFGHIATTSFRVNFALSLAMSVGLFVLMPQINTLLFSSGKLNLTISVYCLSIVFASMLFVANTILQSKNIYTPVMVAIIIGFLFKILTNRLAVDHFGIIGSSYSTVASLIIMLVVLMTMTSHELRKLFSEQQFGKLVLILIVMAASVWLVATGVNLADLVKNSRLESFVITVICVPLGIGIFFIGCKWLNVFTLREWLTIPMVSRFIKIKGANSNEN